ncbi:hypothetical protein CHU93_12785 [Sandarakinorhabdus cyanobacteriorum]|uniref:Proline iminopeptidase n=1 Tax=Sandarakinorhabdus cyanobacteriorum TaxID=1981098 RepID=A0A255YA48_9SPHN|nr:hypothetical protein CHU93_12785 [Sandarakinorhabdus cyanobacteriorum]
MGAPGRGACTGTGDLCRPRPACRSYMFPPGGAGVPRSSRTGPIAVLVAGPTARCCRRRPQSHLHLPGGPGQAATRLTGFYARIYAGARSTHDIVLIDQRGTGGSAPLNCRVPANQTLADLFDPAIISTCRAQLSARHRLAAFTTSAAVADAEAVRQAFGYGRIDLYGTSYGTRVAMEYARRYPDHVRTLTLKGVVPPWSIMPADFAPDVQAAVALMLRDCTTDHACHDAFPDLAGDLARAVARLDEAPATAVVDAQPLRLQRGMFGTVIRTMLQATPLRAGLPLLLHEAAGGNWQGFIAQAAALRRAAQNDIATGLMLSVACSEDVPFIDRARAQLSARGTVLGRYWIDQLIGGCARWPRGSVPADWREPYRLAGPALLISGELDPATPPAGAEQVARLIDQAHHVLVTGSSHSFAGMNGCVDRIMTTFVVAGSMTGLDTGCTAAIRPPAFKH